MKYKIIKKITGFLLILFIACFTGCVSSEDSFDGAADSLAQVKIPVIGMKEAVTEIRYLDLFITAPDIENPIHKQLDLQVDEPEFLVEISAGINRNFEVVATNTDGQQAYKGNTTTDLIAGITQSVNIPLYFQLAKVSGYVFSIDFEYLQPGLPLTNYNNSDGTLPFTTDSEGYFEFYVQPQNEEFTIDITLVDGASAYAKFIADQPQMEVQVELYLMPLGENDQPLVCSVVPLGASPGDTVAIFGWGFDLGAEFDPLEVLISESIATDTIRPPYITIIDNTFILVEIPLDITLEGDLMLYVTWNGGQEPSNRVPFTIYF